MEEQRILSSSAPRAKVRVERNSKGYVWEVEFAGEDLEEAYRKVVGTEGNLRETYGREKDGG